MMCGMRNLPMMMGASRMMSNTTEKMSVGLVMGKYVLKISIYAAKVRFSENKNKENHSFFSEREYFRHL